MALRVAPGDVRIAARRLRSYRAVAYAEPNYVMRADSTTPNDPSFPLQWADSNSGQAIPTQESGEVLGPALNGTPGDDDGAANAWSVSTGSNSIVIGETDTGVDYEHPDLAANVWSNTGGIGGCPAGTHGYNVWSRNCSPMDDDSVYGGHGSHVAGIMGAVGNNGTGVAGMNWHTSILPVKWLSSEAWGETSGLIEALQWVVRAKQEGVNIRVVNDSATFPGTAYSEALSNEIDTLGANNILFVTAAGNTGQNNDEQAVRRYPCGYDRPSEICATASDNNDKLPSWANYGAHTVDLAAPGVSIYSTLREGKYGYLSGGSMASPQVAGAAALILSVDPTLSPQELKSRILANVTPVPALAGKLITGGILDVCKAMPGCESKAEPPPPATFGKTGVGGSYDTFSANRKRVNRYTLVTAGSVSKLSIYLAPTATAGQQTIEGLIYSDSSGKPANLLGATSQLTFKNTNQAGWYDLTFPAALKLAAGNYWIGIITGATGGIMSFRYDSVSGARVYNTNTYTSGPTTSFGTYTNDNEQMSLYATYSGESQPAGSPPANTTPPSISGTPSTGQTLTAGNGTWTESPSSYAYQWQRCESSGGGCVPIVGAGASTYTLGSADAGRTLRVGVTASNAAGSSAAAISTQTAVVQQAPARFGKTGVGGSYDTFSANRKRVNRYTLVTAGSVSKLSIYLAPTATAGQQTIEGLIYSDSSGKPANLLGATSQLTFKNTNQAGWYDLTFPAALKLAAGNYWIGIITGATGGIMSFRYDSVSGARVYNTNTYTSGPTTSFGTYTNDNEQMSLYATYAAG